MMSLTFEVAVDSFESALIAQQCGAHRVELTSALGIGGITPSHGMLKLAREKLDIPMNVIIRPRQGDFLYTDAEFDIMLDDVRHVKSLDFNGVVIGILTHDGTIDIERTQLLITEARPLEVTFHRAFDMTKGAFQALDDLIELGVDTVLTSGKQASVQQGLSLIKQLVQRSDERITIMPGGGITADNIADIVAGSGAKTFHFSGKKTVDSPMHYRNHNLLMGADSDSEYRRTYADAETIRAIMTSATRN